MKYILLIFISFTFAGELEVNGDLKVTGAINSPSIDALSGMKPERIYSYYRDHNSSFNLTVPENKIWKILATTTAGWAYTSCFLINDKYYGIGNSQQLFTLETWVLPNSTIKDIKD